MLRIPFQPADAEFAVQLSNRLSSFDLLLRQGLVLECDYDVDFLVGYRYAHFGENLAVDATTTFIDPMGLEPSPQLEFASSDVWVQGLRVGFDYRWY